MDGQVASQHRAGVGGLRVRIMDKRVGDDVQLVETVTDEEGKYRASFSDADVKRRGKDRPDLQACVFSGELVLAASDTRYNASIRETLNIFLDEKASSALQSEY